MNNLNNYWAVFKGLNLSITSEEDWAADTPQMGEKYRNFQEPGNG